MQYYLNVDSGNNILGYTNSPVAGNNYIPIDFDPTTKLVGSNIYKLVNNKIVDTGEPIIPPNMWVTWNPSLSKWQDSRSQQQKISNQWDIVKEKRQQLLQESDWTDTYSAHIRLGDKYTEWQTYRQSLRDITNQSDPFNIVWPISPE